MPSAVDNPEFRTWVEAFQQALVRLGWPIGKVSFDIHWATANAAEIRKHAAELAASAPDVILAYRASTVGPLLQTTRTVPVVFPIALDPVATGFAESLARPGGNATTGFMVGTTPEEFDALFKADIRKFAEVVKEAGIPPQD
jgi:putative ABC transport system substrate-binding protein